MQEPIERNKYQYLGYKTFLLFIFQRSFLVILFILISCLTFILRKSFADDGWITEALNLVMNVSFWLAIFSFLVISLNSLIDYSVFRFMFTDNALKITKGIFNKEEIMIPYQKIQSINIDQKFFHQLLGICQLIILTAGNTDQSNQSKNIKAESGCILPAIDDDIARAIQNELLSMMGSAGQKDAFGKDNAL